MSGDEWLVCALDSDRTCALRSVERLASAQVRVRVSVGVSPASAIVERIGGSSMVRFFSSGSSISASKYFRIPRLKDESSTISAAPIYCRNGCTDLDGRGA